MQTWLFFYALKFLCAQTWAFFEEVHDVQTVSLAHRAPGSNFCQCSPARQALLLRGIQAAGF
jgi:hypothetical protein